MPRSKSRQLSSPFVGFSVGAVLGAATIVLIAWLFPASAVAPRLFSHEELRFGKTDDNRPALCDLGNRAYDLTPSGTGIVLMIRRRGGEVVAVPCQVAGVF